jgi:hypothetical protein
MNGIHILKVNGIQIITQGGEELSVISHFIIWWTINGLKTLAPPHPTNPLDLPHVQS